MGEDNHSIGEGQPQMRHEPTTPNGHKRHQDAADRLILNVLVGIQQADDHFLTRMEFAIEYSRPTCTRLEIVTVWSDID